MKPRRGFFASVCAALLRPYLRRLDRPSSPKYHGTLALKGLQQTVTVRWDSFAIPKVFAASETDLFFAQGFLHAQERLWQMELSRRFLGGRTAEIFGDLPLPWQDLSIQFRHRTSADLDYFMRLLGIGSAAQNSLALLSEELRARLDAYCGGVNRYIEQCGKKLPWEFRLLRHRPEPWRAEDTLIISKGLALLLSTALYSRLNFFAVANKLKDQPAKLQELFPAHPPGAPVIARALWDQAESVWRFSNDMLAVTDWHPAGAGSNSWAVAPTRSQTGAALLCNDPHLRMSLPSIWYLVHLKSEEQSRDSNGYDVWGASIPGCPLVQIGRNRSIAWGITAAVCDDVEIYRERLHRVEPDRYLAGSEWRRFEITREEIRIRRSPPIERVVRQTRHGPVISDFSPTSARGGEVLSVRWTAHEPGEEMRSLYGVNRASSWQEFQDSLRHHGAPTLNFVYADQAGNIGYALAGKVPRRARVPTLQPLAGWNEENEWRGYIRFEELPRIFNPPEGWIATANNRITDDAYADYLSHFFEPPFRFRRIGALLNSREKHTTADLAGIQLDDLSLHAHELIAVLSTELTRIGAADPSLADTVNVLLSWDGRCSATSVAATIFHVFHHRLLFNLLVPDLGEDLFPAYVEILNQCIAPTDRILADPNSPWFAERSRAELVRLSLREARGELAQALDENAQTWHWGRIHRLSLNHSLSRVPALKSLLTLGPLSTPGDGMTINLGFYRHSNPYAQTVGASMRFIADLSAHQSAEFILPSGQSGHPWSNHYADQTRLWTEGRRITLTPVSVDNENQRRSLVLEPGGAL
jgi:penicillin amidase